MSSSQIGDYNKSELFWFMWFRSIFTLGFVLQLTWRSKDSFLPPFLLVDKVNNYMFPRMEERIRNSRTAAGPAKPASAVSPPALCPNHRKVVWLSTIYLHIFVELLTQSHKRSLLGWCFIYYLLFICMTDRMALSVLDTSRAISEHTVTWLPPSPLLPGIYWSQKGVIFFPL